MLCAKQGPKAGSFFLYVLLNDIPVQLSAVYCDVPVIRDLDAHKYLLQINRCAHIYCSMLYPIIHFYGLNLGLCSVS